MTAGRELLGYRFSYGSEVAGLEAYLDRTFADLPRVHDVADRYEIRPTEGGGAVVEQDGRQIFTTPVGHHALSHLLWHVNRAAIDSARADLLLHASAAATVGQGVVFPAPMESGKSTLVAGLVRAGFDYLTDEAAIVSLDDGLVHPYPKPITIDLGSFAVLSDLEPDAEPDAAPYLAEHWHLNPDHIRTGSVGTATPPRWLVTPRYVAGSATTLRAMSRADAIVVLAENSFNLLDLGEPGLVAAAHLVTKCGCFSLTVGDLTDAVRVLGDLCTTTLEPGVLEVLSATAAERDSPNAQRGARRATGVSSVVVDGEAVLLDCERKIHRLNPSGTAVWGLLDGDCATTEVVELVAAANDLDPATTEAQVASMIADLTELGLVDPATDGNETTRRA